MATMNALTVEYPRPAGVGHTVSQESYARAVRMWTMGSSDGLIAGLLECPLENLPVITGTIEWINAARQLHQLFEAQMEIEHSRVIARALKEIEDRLINGDVIQTKYGAHRAPARMKDIAATAKILFDNRKEFQRMAAGQADPQQTHADALMRIAQALSAHQAIDTFRSTQTHEVIEVENESSDETKMADALSRLGLNGATR